MQYISCNRHYFASSPAWKRCVVRGRTSARGMLVKVPASNVSVFASFALTTSSRYSIDSSVHVSSVQPSAALTDKHRELN